MNIDKIFSLSKHLTHEQIVAYKQHQLVGKELHEVEKHLVDCELCNDALSGFHNAPDFNMMNAAEELRKMVKKRQLIRKPIFSQLDIITLMAIIFLIIFLIIIAIVLFIRK
jgi:hypothetical protein